MENQAATLVLTKLRPPASRQSTVHRQRLLERLSAEDAPGFALVCAAAGYGKTTLLAEWVHSLAGRCSAAWVSLDEGDDAPGTFASYLTAAFLQAFGSAPELSRLAQGLHSSTEVDLLHAMAVIINAAVVYAHACVLVLDDYHLITSPAIHTSMAYLLEHRPANLRVVIGSRADPPLSLARLRAHGSLLELRRADLRFTPAETAAFLNEIMALGLPAETLAELDASTEGWVTGLQLAGLSLAPGSSGERSLAAISGSHRYLADYLMEEVVGRQSNRVRDFLQTTAVLERLCAPLCDAVTGLEGTSGAILEALEHANLFLVALDEQEVWFRYHHLFRDYLLSRLVKTHPESVPTLHRSACEWLAENGHLHEAAAHAFRVGNWEYAAAFVERHSFTLITRSDIATIYEWCSRFPEEVLQAHPFLCIHQCWALALSFRKVHRERVEMRLRQALLAGAALADPHIRAQVEEMAGIIRTFLAMAPDPRSDPRPQLDAARSLLNSYPAGYPGRFSPLLLCGYAHMALNETGEAEEAIAEARQIALRSHLYFGAAESSFNLARLAQARGQLDCAVEICRECLSSLAALLEHPETDLPGIGCLDIALGCVLLEKNQLQEAEAHLRHGLELVGPGMNPGYTFAACTSLARLYAIQNRADLAAAFLDRLDEAWPDASFCTAGLKVIHALRDHPEDASVQAQAVAWRQAFEKMEGEMSRQPGLGPFGGADVFYLARTAWAEAGIRLGMEKTAAAWIEETLAAARENGLAARVIQLDMLLALAGEFGKDTRRSRLALEDALAAGEACGLVRSFDLGPPSVKILTRAVRLGPYRNVAGRILAALKTQPAAAAAAPVSGARYSAAGGASIVEALSSRELDVLRLISQGASNQEIAEELVITVGTAKSHINHILRKLNARNRTEAAAQARRLGLIP